MSSGSLAAAPRATEISRVLRCGNRKSRVWDEVHRSESRRADHLHQLVGLSRRRNHRVLPKQSKIHGTSNNAMQRGGLCSWSTSRQRSLLQEGTQVPLVLRQCLLFQVELDGQGREGIRKGLLRSLRRTIATCHLKCRERRYPTPCRACHLLEDRKHALLRTPKVRSTIRESSTLHPVRIPAITLDLRDYLLVAIPTLSLLFPRPRQRTHKANSHSRSQDLDILSPARLAPTKAKCKVAVVQSRRRISHSIRNHNNSSINNQSNQPSVWADINVQAPSVVLGIVFWAARPPEELPSNPTLRTCWRRGIESTLLSACATLSPTMHKLLDRVWTVRAGLLSDSIARIRMCPRLLKATTTSALRDVSRCCQLVGV